MPSGVQGPKAKKKLKTKYPRWLEVQIFVYGYNFVSRLTAIGTEVGLAWILG